MPKKIEGDPLEIFFPEKSLTMPKKTERRNPLGFSNIHSVAKHQKMQGDPLRKKIREKNSEKNVSQCRKKLKGGTLWSRPVWYVTRENMKNLFGSVR